MAEAMVLGAKSGVDPELLLDVVKNSSGTSKIFESRVPTVIERDFSTRSTLGIQLKDIDISVRTADSVKAPAFLSIVCRELFKLAGSKFDSNEDSSAIVKLCEELGEVRVGKQPLSKAT
ncbi:MAG: NAD-binding protein [Negativicutes bacterium]